MIGREKVCCGMLDANLNRDEETEAGYWCDPRSSLSGFRAQIPWMLEGARGGEPDLGQTVGQRFEQTARRWPTRPALLGPREEVWYRYGELLDRICAVAVGVAERWEADRGPIGLLFKDPQAQVVAMLAAIRAGRAFVNLDPKHPLARSQGIVGSAGLAGILTEPSLTPQADAIGPGKGIVSLDELPGTGSDSVKGGPETILVINTTSGTTAQPKAVAATHGTILYVTSWRMSDCCLGPHDRVAIVGSMAFAMVSGEVLKCLLTGVAVRPVGGAEADVGQLGEVLKEEGITILHTVPAVWRSLDAQLGEGERFPALRLLMLGGDRSRRSDIEVFRRRAPPEAYLRISMGMTETAGTVARCYLCAADDVPDKLPVGYVVPGQEVTLVGSDGKPVSMGETGLIEIRGRYLPTGYWNNPDLSRGRYVDLSGSEPGMRLLRTEDLGYFDKEGLLYHAGREGREVKIRGQRVDTGAIESALVGLPEVRNAAVRTWESPQGTRLAAYLEPGTESMDVQRVSEHLRRELPAYMVPSSMAVLGKLPVNAHGKVDLEALPEPDFRRPVLATPYKPPESLYEVTLERMWRAVVGVDRIGIDDSFFELGGDSLLAASMLGRVRIEMNRQVELNQFLEGPTLRQLAGILERGDSEPVLESDYKTLVPIVRTGSRPPLYLFHGWRGEVFVYAGLARELGPDQPVYGVQAVEYSGQSRMSSLRAMAELYAEEISRFQPTGTLGLGGYSLGAIIAYATAVRLREMGRELRPLLVLDARPMGLPWWVNLRMSRYLWLGLVRKNLRDLGSGKEPIGSMLRSRWRGLKDRLAGRRSLNPDAPAAEMEQERFYRNLVQSHHPEPSHVAIELIQTSGNNYDLASGWRYLAKAGVRSTTVPGGHYDFIVPERVPAVVEALRSYLKENG